MSRQWYGSLENRLMENAKMPEPVVGMGVTECSYTDREPYEVIEVKDPRHITIRALDWKRVDGNGLSECQDYEYSSNEANHPVHLFLTKQGKWRERYPDGHLGCDGFYLGSAERYYDPCF